MKEGPPGRARESKAPGCPALLGGSSARPFTTARGAPYAWCEASKWAVASTLPSDDVNRAPVSAEGSTGAGPPQ